MTERKQSAEVTFSPFARTLNRLRNQAIGLLELGYGAASIAALISLVGVAYWCPRCGAWMGPGSEGVGPNVPKPKAPPPPDRLLKAISTPTSSQPTPPIERQSPSVARNELHPPKTKYEGQLRSPTTHNDQPAIKSYLPPGSGHGRKENTYWGGYPEADSRPHAHLAEFRRGDGEVVGVGGDDDPEKRIYERPKEGPPDYDSSTSVTYNRDTGAYVWSPQFPRRNEDG